LFFTIISFSARLLQHTPFIAALIEATTSAEARRYSVLTNYVYARNAMKKSPAHVSGGA
jgi:hypothetical protein